MALGFFSTEETLSPEAIERRRKTAEALLGKASDTSPIKHWTQGAARLLDGVAGKFEDSRLNDAEKSNQEYNRQQIAALLGGGSASDASGGASIAAGASASPMALSGATQPTPQGAVMPPDAVKQVIDQNVPEADRPYYYQLAKKESSFNPAAVSPTGATGLLQFTKGTGRDYGLVGPDGDRRADPVANIQAGVKLTEDNRARLVQALGRQPTMGELALAHQQGAGGAISLLRGGNVPAQNLAVNNAGGLSGRAAANKIMGYYGMPGMDRSGPAQMAGVGAVPAVNRLTPQQAAGIGAVPAVQTGAQTTALASMTPQEATMPLGDAAAPQSPFGTLDTSAVGGPSWKGMDTPAPGMGMAPQAPQAPAQQAISQAAPQRQQLAQAVMSGPPAAAQAPVSPGQGGPMSNRAAVAAALMTDPRASPAVKQIAAGILTQSINPQFGFQVVGDQLYRTNTKTGQAEPMGIAATKPMTVGADQRLIDPATGRVIAGPTSDANTPDQKNYQAAVAQGYKGTLNDWLTEVKKAGATPDDEFGKKVATKQAEMFIGLADEGMAGQGELATIRQLRGQIEKLPGGFFGGAQQIASQYGIKLGPNAGAVEAADAILNKLTPAQRQGMPGAASDRDVAMFRGSLPKLSNTPGGNKIIMDTMEALATQKMQRAEIANAVMSGQMTRTEGMKQLQTLPDPFAAFKAATGNSAGSAEAVPAGRKTKTGVTWGVE